MPPEKEISSDTTEVANNVGVVGLLWDIYKPQNIKGLFVVGVLIALGIAGYYLYTTMSVASSSRTSTTATVATSTQPHVLTVAERQAIMDRLTSGSASSALTESQRTAIVKQQTDNVPQSTLTDAQRQAIMNKLTAQ